MQSVMSGKVAIILNNPNVLILVENLPVPFDRRVWNEATTLQQAGYQVQVVCPRSKEHPQAYEILEGIKIRRYRQIVEGRSSLSTVIEYLWALLCMTWHAISIAIHTKIDVVHICNPPDLLFLATWPLRLRRDCRVVFDQHDICPELWEAKGHSNRSVLSRLMYLAEWFTYKSSDVVISTNESFKEIAMMRGKKPANQVFVVRSAPRKSFAIDLPPNTRSAQEAHRIVYIGIMGAQDGLDLLLVAMAELISRDKFDKIHLDLVGDGPERPSLEILSKKLDLQRNVTFHGLLAGEFLRKVAINADIAVSPDRPNRMNDLSSMNKIVEYMALGKPIIQFDCLEGGRTALKASIYVKTPSAEALSRAIVELLNDSPKREFMSNFGHQRFIDSLTWESQEKSLLDAYRFLGTAP